MSPKNEAKKALKVEIKSRIEKMQVKLNPMVVVNKRSKFSKKKALSNSNIEFFLMSVRKTILSNMTLHRSQKGIKR